MRDDMGSFRVDVEIENAAVPAEILESLAIERYGRWRFRQADGTVLERWTGAAA